jgi:hypothetical protein
MIYIFSRKKRSSMKDRYNSFRHDGQALHTIEGVEKQKLYDEERIIHSKIMPAIRPENKQFIHSITTVNPTLRGNSASNKHTVVAYGDSLAPPLKELPVHQLTLKHKNSTLKESSLKQSKSGRDKMYEPEIILTKAQKEQKSIYQQFHNAVR